MYTKIVDNVGITVECGLSELIEEHGCLENGFTGIIKWYIFIKTIHSFRCLKTNVLKTPVTKN